MDQDFDPLSRRRSRSPRSSSYSKHHRERSPRPHSHHHRSDNRRKYSPRLSTARNLPFNAPQLSKTDFNAFKMLFASYLDIQKGLILDELDKVEGKGRWKSFMRKWNRGELAEGWYDPSTRQKALESSTTASQSISRRRSSPSYGDSIQKREQTLSNSEDDGPGPSLPDNPRQSRHGPAIPTMQDLELKRELAADDLEDMRTARRLERRADSKREQQRLEELQPRAEPGTRERQLEKKRELAASNRAFAVSKGGGDGMAEVGEADLMGGGDEDGVEGFKRQKMVMERKKNEREIRREEILRARKEEREQRAQEFREREERTMAGLVELARRRFG